MAKEYIEREAFREYAMEMTESTEIQFDMCYPYWQFSKAIKEMPAADVAPVRHGRWSPLRRMRTQRKGFPILSRSKTCSMNGLRKIRAAR